MEQLGTDATANATQILELLGQLNQQIGLLLQQRLPWLPVSQLQPLLSLSPLLPLLDSSGSGSGSVSWADLSSSLTSLLALNVALIALLLVLLVLLLALLAGLLQLVYLLSNLLCPPMDLRGKHVLITGGSSGIGLETAREYLRRGAKVTIIARDSSKLQAAKADLEASTGGTVFGLSIDVTGAPDSISQQLEAALSQHGAVDVLVNCAGTSVAAPFDALPINQFERMMNINYLGAVYVTRAVIGGMKRKGEGRIVFVASQAAQATLHGYSAYGASKWALRGLAEALQMEVKPFGIYVSVAYPPDTDTPGYEIENLTKPSMTQKLSESGSVFSAQQVASDIVTQSGKRYFGITTGFDGFLLKAGSPGMTPVNNLWEVFGQILLSSPLRLVSVGYLLVWDYLVKQEHRKGGVQSDLAASTETSTEKDVSLKKND